MNSFLNPLFWQQNLEFDLISNSPYSPSTFLSLTGFELRPNLNLFNCSPSSSSPNWRFQPPAPSTHLHSYCSWRFKPLTLLRLKRKYISPLIYVVSHPIYEYQNFYKNLVLGSDPMLGQIPKICEFFLEYSRPVSLQSWNPNRHPPIFAELNFVSLWAGHHIRWLHNSNCCRGNISCQRYYTSKRTILVTLKPMSRVS